MTTEFGEAAARRRVCLVATSNELTTDPLTQTTSRETLAPPMGAKLDATKDVAGLLWKYPIKLTLDAGIPRAPLLPMIKGHFWLQDGRRNLASTSGPLRWPLKVAGQEGVEDSFVYDPRGPCGAIRQLSPVEVWRCQGRSSASFEALKKSGMSDGEILVEGGKATGAETAMALVLMAGYVTAAGDRGVAGVCKDILGDENLSKVLSWLLKWRRGLLPRSHDSGAGAGGHGEDHRCGSDRGLERVVWRWLEDDEDRGGRAGGRRSHHKDGKDKVHEAIGNATVLDQFGLCRPFNGGVGALVEEWIEDNLCGYLADSTAKQYAGVYGKWRAWARRQGWHSEFLDKGFPAEDNEEKLLGFLGYLGWLGASAATIKQAVFAVKDGHKRFGKGDPTERMWRLWMLLSAWEKRATKQARRLGVTPEMLKWVKTFLCVCRGEGCARLDSAMLNAAVTTAWFFMLRAKEYCSSGGVDYGMITRGCDIKFILDATGQQVIGVTLQFRKTKTDQEAFGSCKTMYRSGVEDLCVVSALLQLQVIAPQRFNNGSAALQPLFR